MEKWTTPEMQGVLNQLLHRTGVDKEFRKLALEDSVAAFAAVTPKPLPESMSFRFVDNEGPVKTIPIA